LVSTGISTVLFGEGVLDRCLNSIELIYKSLKVVLKLRWVVEPSMNYIEDNDSPFRNSWLLGGYAGFDFDTYTGIRVFYLQATENETISTNFDKLAMYGVEFRARLNDGNR
jgi:hypothetical protein